jgi:hypothetical protein
MTEQSIQEGRGNVPSDLKDLAAEFDRLSKERDPLHRVHVIDQHFARPESFRWFVAGVLYERQRKSIEKASTDVGV